MEQKARTKDGCRCRNEILLDDFTAWLRENGTSSGRALQRRKQVSAYLNGYVLDVCGAEMEEGAVLFTKYFRSVYPQKQGISDEDLLENAESVRLFYACMKQEEYLCEKTARKLKRRYHYVVHVTRLSHPGRKRTARTQMKKH